MRLSKWTEYGIILLQRMVIGATYNEDGEMLPASARKLAIAESLPVDFSEQVMLKLRTAGIVRSLRGAKGGYLFAIAPGALAMSAIFNAFEPDTFTVDADTDFRVRPMLANFRTAMFAHLDSVTLADTLAK